MDLWELIEANKRGRTVQELMQDSGGHITDRNYFISGSIKKKRAFPAREKILGLAAALEVSPLEVVLATAESLGLADGATSVVPAGDDTALLRVQTRADRLQDALETERDLVRELKARVSRLQSRAKEQQSACAAEPSAEPWTADSEAEYWREHAMRYRQRLARYEGLRRLPTRNILPK